MTLYQILQRASSEEDVKDAYIQALGLKGYQKDFELRNVYSAFALRTRSVESR